MGRTGQRVGSTLLAVTYIAIPVVLATLGFAFIATGDGSNVAIGVVILIFCLWRIIAAFRWWAREMR